MCVGESQNLPKTESTSWAQSPDQRTLGMDITDGGCCNVFGSALSMTAH